jgi:hypothetical protein
MKARKVIHVSINGSFAFIHGKPKKRRKGSNG